MLTLFHGGNEYPIQNTEYYIRELANGLDEVILDLSIYDPIYAIIAEEENIVDRTGQRYLVKQIDAGSSFAKIVCQLDIDDWKEQMYVNYDSGSKTCVQQLEAIKPTGWTVLDRAHVNIQRTIKGNYTPYEICVECTGIYQVYIRWDNKTKECTIYPKAMGSPVGAFATRELNLKEINYKGKSNNLATRLYAYGKDGLSFASINDNKPYVDNNTYDSRIISAYWQDERYTVAADLLADAQEKLALLAVPERSYDCSIVDLQATNPDLYNNLDFSLFTTATLIDDVKETAVNYQVVERHIYPYQPERNEVIFDSAPQKITAEVVNIVNEIENPNSDFQQIQAQRIAAATNWLLDGDGYVVAVQDSNGEWKELLFMDTNDTATAQKVLRINENGIGFSSTGVNGPYTNAWTIDGQLVADFITTGTLTANLIKAGVIQDQQGKFSLNMETGALTMNSGTFKGTVSGGTISGGTISGANITSQSGSNYVSINGAQLSVYGSNFIRMFSGYPSSGGYEYELGFNSARSHARNEYAYGYQECDSIKIIVAANNASDERLKTNIKELSFEDAWAYLTASKPYSFNFKKFMPNKKRFGLIAQEFKAGLDKYGEDTDHLWVLNKNECDNMYCIEYQELVPHLIKVVTTQQEEIEALKKDIEDIKKYMEVRP